MITGKPLVLFALIAVARNIHTELGVNLPSVHTAAMSMNSHRGIHSGEVGIIKGDNVTKQEEIKKGITGIIQSGVSQDFAGVDVGSTPEDIIEYLHSQGVVIKVDRELPITAYLRDCWNCSYKNLVPCPYAPRRWTDRCKNFLNKYLAETGCKRCMLKAGYAAVEPLIKE